MANEPQLTRIETAVYGAVGNAHGLITSSVPKDQLPPDLSGIVDKPPHHPENGLPILACARVEPFLAVWRTVDDPEAARRGMVRSYVALLRIGQLADVNNIAEITSQLPREFVEELHSEGIQIENRAPTPRPTPPRYRNLCELLARSDRVRPVILPDEGDWEELLATLWSFLWPEARAYLTCLHAAGPESEPSTSTTVLVTPASAVNKWANYPIVDHTVVGTEAARLLYGEPSPRIKRLHTALGALPGDLRLLGLLDNAASILEAADSRHPPLVDLKMLLESIIRLSPTAQLASDLKSLILGKLAESVKGAKTTDILSLSNLDVCEAGIVLTPLMRAIQMWVAQRMAGCDPQDAARIIARLADNRFADWWRTAIREGLTPVVAAGPVSLWETIWSWASHRPAVLSELTAEVPLPEGAEVTVARACPRKLSGPLSEAAIAVAHTRGWSRLHAVVLASIASPHDAFEKQLAFEPRPREGLPFLLDRLEAGDIIDLAVAERDDDLRRRAVSTLVAAPGLLSKLDITSAPWRDLWQRAIAAGLRPWSGVREPGRIAQQIVDLVASAAPMDSELATTLCKELPDLPNGVPAAFWEHATVPVRDATARALASQWLVSFGKLPDPSPPTPEIVPAVLAVFAEQVTARAFRIDLLPKILQVTEERGFVQRLLECPGVPISASVARELGLRIINWGDSALAETAFARWNAGWRDLQPLLIECRSLLRDNWDRLKVPGAQKPSAEDVHALLMELRPIARELYPEGPPDHLWEDAGGKPWAMFRGSTGEENWTQALLLIARGAHGAPYARRLIEEIRKAFPNSPHEERLQILQRWLHDR